MLLPYLLTGGPGDPLFVTGKSINKCFLAEIWTVLWEVMLPQQPKPTVLGGVPVGQICAVARAHLSLLWSPGGDSLAGAPVGPVWRGCSWITEASP